MRLARGEITLRRRSTKPTVLETCGRAVSDHRATSRAFLKGTRLGGAAKESAPDLHVLVLLDSTRQIRLRARHRGCCAPPGPLQRDDTLGTGFPLPSSISAFLRRTARPPYAEETSAVAATDEGMMGRTLGFSRGERTRVAVFLRPVKCASPDGCKPVCSAA